MSSGKSFVFRDDFGETYLHNTKHKEESDGYVPRKGESEFSPEERVAQMHPMFQKFITIRSKESDKGREGVVVPNKPKAHRRYSKTRLAGALGKKED